MEMRETDRCYECGKPGRVAGTVWGGSGYLEYCEACMKKFADDQYVGMTVRHDDEDDYEERLCTKYGPRKLIAFNDHSGEMMVFSVPDNEVERMCIYEICPLMVGNEWPDCKTCPYADGTEGDERMDPMDERETVHYGHLPKPWVVECYCGARGPASDTELGAIEEWNRRDGE